MLTRWVASAVRRMCQASLFPFAFVVLVLIAGSTPAFPQDWNPLEIIEGLSDIKGSGVEVSQELIAKRRKRIREISEELGLLPEPGMDSRTCVKEAERLYKEGLELSKWIAEPIAPTFSAGYPDSNTIAIRPTSFKSSLTNSLRKLE